MQGCLINIYDMMWYSTFCLCYDYFLWLYSRTDSRFAPSQWEMALLCNDVSHWLCALYKQAPMKGYSNKRYRTSSWSLNAWYWWLEEQNFNNTIANTHRSYLSLALNHWYYHKKNSSLLNLVSVLCRFSTFHGSLWNILSMNILQWQRQGELITITTDLLIT